ncbi:hypothetical protein HG530_004419 [Fusarium avenaceum]|nr:hypothetical protein HG530_004419 [Fusarium avenaceum]
MLLPCGGLFKSLEHFRSIFCPVNEVNPQGVWRDLYRRLYRVLVFAHPRSIVGLPAMITKPEEFRFDDRVSILRIDTLMMRFNTLLRIERHCGSGSGRNMFTAMGLLSQAEQLSACPLLHGATLQNPKQAKRETEEFVAIALQLL